MKISIIVTIYNIDSYITKCIESIINQSYKDIEIILIDDGSTDSSGKICDEYKKMDDRIIVLHKANGGLVSARKAGANIAAGQYIIGMDGDDWLENDYVENFSRAAIESEADIIWTISHTRDYGTHCDIWRAYCAEGLELDNNNVQENLLDIVSGKYGFQNDIEYSVWTKCVKKDVYLNAQNRVSEKIVQGEDLAFTVFCLCETRKVKFIDNKGYHYIQRPNSIVHNAAKYSTESDDILFKKLTSYLNEQKKDVEGLKNVVSSFYIRAYALHDFSKLQYKNAGYLYPFDKVKNNSRIIIYGAGKIGRNIMSYLSKTDGYEVIAWCDSHAYGNEIDGHIVKSIADILSSEYDFIVLATNKTRLADEMRAILIRNGVSDYKICEIPRKISIISIF